MTMAKNSLTVWGYMFNNSQASFSTCGNQKLLTLDTSGCSHRMTWTWRRVGVICLVSSHWTTCHRNRHSFNWFWWCSPVICQMLLSSYHPQMIVMFVPASTAMYDSLQLSAVYNSSTVWWLPIDSAPMFHKNLLLLTEPKSSYLLILSLRKGFFLLCTGPILFSSSINLDFQYSC